MGQDNRTNRIRMAKVKVSTPTTKGSHRSSSQDTVSLSGSRRADSKEVRQEDSILRSKAIHLNNTAGCHPMDMTLTRRSSLDQGMGDRRLKVGDFMVEVISRDGTTTTDPILV